MFSSPAAGSGGRAGTIALKGIAKRYRRGEMQLHRSVTRWITGNVATDEFWALQDVTTTIAPGESVGIVGPNAAGKSTLLRIIAGITAPTTGTVETHGRIGSLIELGAGFHPELTGRENLALLGTLLGFSRPAMRDRMDDIISFADIGPFLDTPVKRYSSGMHARLGFAIAVSVDPHILLIDEALSVGDARFQEKCLARIEEFSRSGVTIILVSHAAELIMRACERALWIDRGVVRGDGPLQETMETYLRATRAPEAAPVR